MSLSKKTFYFLFLIGLVFGLPSYADPLDDECRNFCVDNDFADGHYLAPEPGAACHEGYVQNQQNEICCCKPKAET
jgi:hypothetical protein